MIVKDYDITYIDKKGNSYTFSLMSIDARTAMSTAFELRPEIKRIIRCAPQPMFED